MKSWCVSSVG